MTPTERSIYLSVGSVDLATSIFNVCVLLGVRALKEPPSDILLVLTLYSITRAFLIYATVSTPLPTQSTTTPTSQMCPLTSPVSAWRLVSWMWGCGLRRQCTL